MLGSVGEGGCIALVLRSRGGVGRGGSEAQTCAEAPACCGAMAGLPERGLMTANPSLL